MLNRPIMRDVNTPSNLIQSNNLSPFLMEKKYKRNKKSKSFKRREI